MTSSCRWLKYEEKVEDVGRWSKPHVSIAYLHALQLIHHYVSSGKAIVELDLHLEGATKQKLADSILAKARKDLGLAESACVKLRDIIASPYKHANRGKDKAKHKAATLTPRKDNERHEETSNGGGKQ